MIKGTVMLLATLVSSAFSVNASEEVSMLIPSKSVATDLNVNGIYSRLEDKIIQLDKTLLQARQVYFDLANADKIENDALVNFDDLVSLDLTLRGTSEYLKRNWTLYNEDILNEHGSAVHQNFKDLVAKFGQLRKNISNICKVIENSFNEIQPKTNNSFSPSEDFFIAANKVTNEILNIH
tara:strand:- start:87 stop:626 length:540 start_codon:yes stop_codon:yes gene_type:complete